MTEALAIEMAWSQMLELGVSDSYLLRYRHLRIGSQKKRTLRAENQFFYLLEMPLTVTIKSKAGIFNMKDSGVSEQQHVHRGIITLENTGEEISDVRFLQVIPSIINTKKH
ncbi:MAG: hypothetical protein HYZ14_15330 [Bacteroidetes bacterium]|nr:hypothetical protein [Bacteroidota bacterium]